MKKLLSDNRYEAKDGEPDILRGTDGDLEVFMVKTEEKDDELKEIRLPEPDDDSLLLDDDDLFGIKPKKKIPIIDDEEESLDALAEAEDEDDSEDDYDSDEW